MKWDIIINNSNIITTIGSTYKIVNGDVLSITAYPEMQISGHIKHYLVAFSYLPVYICETIINFFPISVKAGIYTFEDIIENLPVIYNLFTEEDITLSMEGITEITEDEYYKID